MGPYQRTPKEVAIELLDSQVCFGVRSVGAVGDFLDIGKIEDPPHLWRFLFEHPFVTILTRDLFFFQCCGQHH